MYNHNFIHKSIRRISPIRPIRPIHISQKGLIKLSKNALTSYLIVATLLFGTGIAFLIKPFWGGDNVEAAWFNDNWAYRQEVPITANASADADAFFSFSLDTATLITAGQLQSSCQDIRVTDQNGNILPYHIGRTNACNNAATTIDALAPYAPNSATPTLPAGASTFYVYYGNPSVTSADQGAFSQSEAASYTVGTLGTQAKAPSPMNYWKLDDAQGTTAQDSTANNKPLTLAASTATPTWQTENMCVSGKCLLFDGSNDYASTSSITAPIGSQTYAAWIKTSTTGEQGISTFSQAAPANSTYDRTLRITSSNTVQFYITTSGGSPGSVTSTSTVTDGKWHYVVGVYDGSAARIYIDGQLENSTASGTISGYTGYTTPNFNIGDTRNNANNAVVYFKGFIDEVKIYNQALTADQIKANYNARSNPEGVSQQQGNNNQNMPNSLSSGLVAYWKMDQASWNGTTGEVVDSSGNGINGESSNAATTSSGKFSYGGIFDGTDDGVQVADNSLLDVTSTQNITITAWIKRTGNDQFNNPQVIIDKQNSASNAGYKFQLGTASSCSEAGTNNGFLCFRAYDGTNTYRISATSNAISADSLWHHVALVLDRSSETASTMFVDGVAVTSTYTGTISSLGNLSNSDYLCIADNSAGPGCDGQHDFRGSIDEVRIYKRPLSSANISQLYNWAPGPVGYWRLDEGSGTSATDASGNGYNGTLTNSPTWTTGKFGGSVSFDGSDDYIQLADLALGGTNRQNVTWSAWVNSNSYASTKGIVSYGVQSLDLGSSGGAQVFCRVRNSSGTLVTVTGTTTLSTSTWYYLTCSYDGALVRAYINGVLDNSSAQTGDIRAAVADTNVGYVLGADSTSSPTLTNFFNGRIDDVKFYNYTRTQAQIVEDMNADHPAPGSPVGTPLAYWKFNEGVENSCSGGTNDACNSGSGGTTYDGANTSSTWSLNGKFGKAYSYNGSSSRVDYGDFTALESKNQASWSFWVRPTTLATSQALLVKANNAATQQSWAIMTDASTSTAIRVRIASGATDQSNYAVTPSGVLANSTWAHVVVAYDGTQSSNATKLQVYVNGIPQTLTFNGTIPTSLQATTSNVRSGAWSDAGGTFFNGILDEMKIYTQTLNASQALLDMNYAQAQVQGALSTSSTAGNDNASTRTAQSGASEYCIPGDSATCTGPTARWDFDEGSGTTARDTSGNGRNGSMSGGSYTTGQWGKAFNFGGNQEMTTGLAQSNFITNSAGTLETWVFLTGSTTGAGADPTQGQGIIGPDYIGMYRTNLGAGTPCSGTSGDKIYFINVDSGGYDCVGVTYTTNTWIHLAWVHSGGTLYAYKNGILQGSVASGNTTPISNNLYLARGGQGDNLNGSIDGVRLFNYARSAAQIAWDYNKGGPIAWWKMDECQGTTINDSAGSNTGTLNIGGSGTYTTPGTCTVSSASSAWYNGATGKRNYSIALDGTNDYINAGNSSSVQITGPMSLSSWFKPSALPVSNPTYYPMITKGYDGSRTGYQLNLQLDANTAFVPQLLFATYNGTPHGVGWTYGSKITTGQWYHAVGTFDGTTWNLYFNGNLVASTTDSVTPQSTTKSVLIGGFDIQGLGFFYFPGQIDDSRIYNYALTASQVQTLYNEGTYRTGPATGAP